MSAHVVAVDLFAFVLAVIGFHLAFRQHFVRRWWRALRPRDPAAPPRPRKPAIEQDEDPVHYVLMIFGMMILAFALILASFTTLYSLMTATLPS